MQFATKMILGVEVAAETLLTEQNKKPTFPLKKIKEKRKPNLKKGKTTL